MVEHGHKTNTTSIEVCAYKCYDENKVVHYSNCCEPPVATFIVKDFPCKDGRVAKWILGRSLATLPTRRLICSQLFYATDGITSSTDGEVSTLTWFAKTSDQLTAGSDEYKMHSKPARMFTGKSVLVVTNDQAQSFLRLLGRPDKAAELQGAITGVHNEAVNEKSCEAAILAGGEGVGQHVYKRPSVMRKSILRKSNSKSAPAAKTDLKEADTIEGVKAIAYQRPSAMRKSILRKSNSNSTPAVKTDAKEADTIEGVKAIVYKRPSVMRKSILRNSNSYSTPAAKTYAKEADTSEGDKAIVQKLCFATPGVVQQDEQDSDDESGRKDVASTTPATFALTPGEIALSVRIRLEREPTSAILVSNRFAGVRRSFDYAHTKK
jgi:hypothetical protein